MPKTHKLENAIIFFEHWLPTVSLVQLSVRLAEITGSLVLVPEILLPIYAIAGVSHLINYILKTIALWKQEDAALWQKLLFTLAPFILLAIIGTIAGIVGVATILTLGLLLAPYIVTALSVFNVLRTMGEIFTTFFEQAIRPYFEELVAHHLGSINEEKASWSETAYITLIKGALIVPAIVLAVINDPLILVTTLKNDKEYKLVNKTTLAGILIAATVGTALFYFVPGLNIIAASILVGATAAYLIHTAITHRHKFVELFQGVKKVFHALYNFTNHVGNTLITSFKAHSEKDVEIKPEEQRVQKEEFFSYADLLQIMGAVRTAVTQELEALEAQENPSEEEISQIQYSRNNTSLTDSVNATTTLDETLALIVQMAGRPG